MSSAPDMSRRTFGRLAGVAACALLPLSLPARAEAQEAPAVTETDEEIVVDNGQVVLTIVDDDLLVGLRSEEHTSELQSRGHLVCRLLLDKKKTPRRACDEGTW